MRQCPNYPAKQFKLNTIKKGFDKNLWIVSKRADNVKFWKKYNKENKIKKGGVNYSKFNNIDENSLTIGFNKTFIGDKPLYYFKHKNMLDTYISKNPLGKYYIDRKKFNTIEYAEKYLNKIISEHISKKDGFFWVNNKKFTNKSNAEGFLKKKQIIIPNIYEENGMFYIDKKAFDSYDEAVEDLMLGHTFINNYSLKKNHTINTVQRISSQLDKDFMILEKVYDKIISKLKFKLKSKNLDKEFQINKKERNDIYIQNYNLFKDIKSKLINTDLKVKKPGPHISIHTENIYDLESRYMSNLEKYNNEQIHLRTGLKDIPGSLIDTSAIRIVWNYNKKKFEYSKYRTPFSFNNFNKNRINLNSVSNDTNKILYELYYYSADIFKIILDILSEVINEIITELSIKYSTSYDNIMSKIFTNKYLIKK